MNNPSVVSANCHFVDVNHRGGWLHVELTDRDGLHGWGEASHSGNDAVTRRLLESALDVVRGPSDSAMQRIARLKFPDDKCGLTAASALEQALFDLSCRAGDESVAQRLTGQPLAGETQVPIYTNLNRMCQDRSPETVAAAVRQAAAAGVDRFKFAPFDEVSVADLSSDINRIDELLQPGAERLHALRSAAGPDAYLMVDCHWRFTPAGLPALERVLQSVNALWIEDPLPAPTKDLCDRLRDNTGALIAGGEHLLNYKDFEQYVTSAGVDVLIADVKHVGGIDAMHRLAGLAARHQLQFAPHNPSGPISTAASAHVVAANENACLLEFPFGEIDWRSLLAPDELVNGSQLRVQGPGLGVDLDLSAAPS